MLRKAIFLAIALSAAAVWEGRAASHGSDEVQYVSPKSPVVRVRHLAPGIDIPFAESDGDTCGAILTFPDGFVRDEYADAFEVEYRK